MTDPMIAWACYFCGHINREEDVVDGRCTNCGEEN